MIFFSSFVVLFIISRQLYGYLTLQMLENRQCQKTNNVPKTSWVNWRLWLSKPTCIPGCLLHSSLKDFCTGWLLSAMLLCWQRHQGDVWKFLSPFLTILLDQQAGDSAEWCFTVNTQAYTWNWSILHTHRPLYQIDPLESRFPIYFVVIQASNYIILKLFCINIFILMMWPSGSAELKAARWVFYYITKRVHELWEP